MFIEKQQLLLEESPGFSPRAIAGDKALTVFRNKWREALKLEAETKQPISILENPKALI